MNLVAIAVALVAVAAALLYPTVSFSIEALKHVPRSFNNANCVTLPYTGCEDLALHSPSSTAFLYCAMDKQRLYFPAIMRADPSGVAQGQLIAYDLSTNTGTPLKITNFQTGGLIPHGLSILESSPGKLTLALVNHRVSHTTASNSTVEIFSHVLGSTELVHTDTIHEPSLLASPNDVVLVAEDEAYVSNEYRYHPTWLRLVQSIMRFKWATVVRWKRGEAVKVVVDGLRNSNGLERSWDSGTVYVSEYYDRKVRVYERKANGNLRETAAIKVPLSPDNLMVEPSSGAVYVAGHVNVLKVLDHLNNPDTAIATTMVVKITNGTQEDSFLGRHYSANIVFEDKGDLISGASGVAYDTKTRKLVLGGLINNAVVCTGDY